MPRPCDSQDADVAELLAILDQPRAARGWPEEANRQFNLVLARRWDMLERFVKSRIRNPDTREYEEIVQETALDIYRGLMRGNYKQDGRAKFSTWMCRCATTRIANRNRTRARRMATWDASVMQEVGIDAIDRERCETDEPEKTSNIHQVLNMAFTYLAQRAENSGDSRNNNGHRHLIAFEALITGEPSEQVATTHSELFENKHRVNDARHEVKKMLKAYFRGQGVDLSDLFEEAPFVGYYLTAVKPTSDKQG